MNISELVSWTKANVDALLTAVAQSNKAKERPQQVAPLITGLRVTLDTEKRWHDAGNEIAVLLKAHGKSDREIAALLKEQQSLGRAL